jgi:glycosyltransferase involved in cell wall biosynthesis
VGCGAADDGPVSAPAARRPRALVVGPTPPPHHGVSIYLESFLASAAAREALDVVHLETADRRSLQNLGRLDAGNVALGVRHVAALVRRVHRHRPDVIYFEISQNAWAYLRDATWMAVAAAARVPLAVRLSGSDFRRFGLESGPFVRRLVAASARSWTRAAVLSHSLRGVLEPWIDAGRIDVVPHGIPDPFSAPERQARLAARPARPVRTVTVLGALHRPKGIFDFLDAAARLRRTNPGLRFLLAGAWVSEADRAAALRIIATGGLGGAVELVGTVTGEDKLDLLLDTDLLVFPGVQPEGQPTVVMEAMSAGLPVVATDRGAVTDMVRDGETGLVVPAGRPAELAAAMASLAADPVRAAAFGAAGRQRFLARFTDAACHPAVAAFLVRTAAMGPRRGG